MILGELLSGLENKIIKGSPDTDISGLAIDSRLVQAKDLFIATEGVATDGHDYLEQAAEAGAAALLVMENHVEALEGYFQDGALPDITIVSVHDTRRILSKMTNRYAGYPHEKFNLIGITGTNGKTSTAVIADSILKYAGHRTGLLGTIENYIGGGVLDTRRTTPTTPDCIELSEIMTKMADSKVDDLIMEVSSMGLKGGRVSDIVFDVGVFTNISPEHLDDHGTMEDYKASKLMLFDISKKAVVNGDDEFSSAILALLEARVLSGHARELIVFGLEDKPHLDLFAEKISYSNAGVSFDVIHRGEDGKANRKVRVSLRTPAEFAVYNSLAAMGACLSSGISFEDCVSALNLGVDISGRYEVITSPSNVTAIVDYAHTARALENLISSVRNTGSYSRIISVFGCGGDRDPSKRAAMGEISGQLADFTIITSDNPRTEEPASIIEEIVRGIEQTGAAYEVIEDRATAIIRAAEIAMQGEVIVLAGKGHEDYQILGTEKIHFDDREHVRAAFGEEASFTA
ncbi:MAG: UDP-N-acetylmuramoyl-L-alanyl-D-glutamate--2,6-diaminopimelate ligase [Clostridiales Family XIII bacterium]|jgi:UDP-N-acetylmuramoyl-L-alanyl-D-glutamate--2,6-diaminopimelate ligase|nr:UDP-N-acetylmuramoyl-L-alanyl-D-glutamate--2,6-diaminopimelate ligase [Clostridiales Family XIII bacterium]